MELSRNVMGYNEDDDNVTLDYIDIGFGAFICVDNAKEKTNSNCIKITTVSGDRVELWDSSDIFVFPHLRQPLLPMLQCMQSANYYRNVILFSSFACVW